ncbi:tyrosine-protein phosphatase non-receptor type 5-like isoform X2 [Centruroides vittatus]|uniref:tyrosine-protein phosphatase non-receptor type 5-like isoform X2 n=1 Tax=Centruroides vittatus TaxID=120091 RepID=UPI00350ECC98
MLFISKYLGLSKLTLLLFVLWRLSECRHVSFSRQSVEITPQKENYYTGDEMLAKSLPFKLQNNNKLIEDDYYPKQDVPNYTILHPNLIPNQYKLVVVFNNSKRNLEENVINQLKKAFSMQLNFPLRNIGIAFKDLYSGIVELYFIYPMTGNFHGSELADGVSILLPASDVLRSTSVSQLKDFIAPFEITSIHSKAYSQENFAIHTSKEEIKVWSVVKDHMWSSWQLPLIISSSLFIIFAISLLILYFCSWKERKRKAIPLEEPRQVVYQPVHKPVTKDVDTVQPENKDNYLTETESENTSSPGRSPLRMKAKGLLERRGSNASLTLDLNRSQENLHCGTPPKECSTEEFLLSAGNRMTRKQLRNCLKDVKALHAEFWEIPMNHPEKVEIPGSGTKNRYKTIMPNEKSRVLLSEDDGDPLSSYINANYIRGYDGEPKTYIATQGPMAHTVDDFWLMIWKEKVPIIVMITKLKEKNKVKCEPYIPDYYGCYDGIEVKVMKVVPKDGYTIRELLLKHEEEMHQVLHFWYTAWPDHKAPSTAKQLLSMALEVEAFRRDNKVSKGPTVVHCSAGIGRTGCFIATSIGIQQLWEENMVDVLGIVCALRLDRGGMVQTAEQYEFVHQALHLFEHSIPEKIGE